MPSSEVGTEGSSTPRRVPALRGTGVVVVAAANKHSAAVTENGILYTWGDNAVGQLGYATAPAGAPALAPRAVDALRERRVTAVAAAKRHTLCVASSRAGGSGGEAAERGNPRSGGSAFHMGHGRAAPRRLMLWRTMPDGSRLRLFVRKVAAGAALSAALCVGGVALYWASDDCGSRDGSPAAEEFPLRGRDAVAVAAGKTRVAAVTALGVVVNVQLSEERAHRGGVGSAAVKALTGSPTVRGVSYGGRSWEGGGSPSIQGYSAREEDRAPPEVRIERVPRLRGVRLLSVGETHSLALTGAPAIPPPDAYAKARAAAVAEAVGPDATDMEGGYDADEHAVSALAFEPPPLRMIAAAAVARQADASNAVYMGETADVIGMDELREHCMELVAQQFDLCLLRAAGALADVTRDSPRYAALLERYCARRWPEASQLALHATNVDTATSASDTAGGETVEIEGVAEEVAHVAESSEGSLARALRAARRRLAHLDELEARFLSGVELSEEQVEQCSEREDLETALRLLHAEAEAAGRMDLLVDEPPKNGAGGAATGTGTGEAELAPSREPQRRPRAAKSRGNAAALGSSGSEAKWRDHRGRTLEPVAAAGSGQSGALISKTAAKNRSRRRKSNKGGGSSTQTEAEASTSTTTRQLQALQQQQAPQHQQAQQQQQQQQRRQASGPPATPHRQQTAFQVSGAPLPAQHRISAPAPAHMTPPAAQQTLSTGHHDTPPSQASSGRGKGKGKSKKGGLSLFLSGELERSASASPARMLVPPPLAPATVWGGSPGGAGRGVCRGMINLASIQRAQAKADVAMASVTAPALASAAAVLHDGVGSLGGNSGGAVSLADFLPASGAAVPSSSPSAWGTAAGAASPSARGGKGSRGGTGGRGGKGSDGGGETSLSAIISQQSHQKQATRGWAGSELRGALAPVAAARAFKETHVQQSQGWGR